MNTGIQVTFSVHLRASSLTWPKVEVAVHAGPAADSEQHRADIGSRSDSGKIGAAACRRSRIFERSNVCRLSAASQTHGS